MERIESEVLQSMRKIVKGKPYDTSTAEKIASAAGGSGDGMYAEVLYRKRTGEFFVYGRGGAASKYRVHVKKDGVYKEGDKVIPLTDATARKWLEAYCPEKVAEVFKQTGEAAMKIATFSIPAHLHEKLKKAALRRGVSASALIAELIEDEL